MMLIVVAAACASLPTLTSRFEHIDIAHDFLQYAKAFHYTGDGGADGVNAAREDFQSGNNDDSCNDHFSNTPNFNDGNEAYCAAFKIAYEGEMIALGATK